MPTLLPTKPVFTGTNNRDLGTLAHALIGSHVQFVHGTAVPGDLLERMYAVAYAVIDANPNRTRVLATEAASYAYRYLTTFVPDAPWRLLGVEYDTGSGEVDLAWTDDTSGQVFFDEVKTSRVHDGRRPEPKWVTQCRRYAAAGTDRFGERFIGVRLLPLMPTSVARLVLVGAPLRVLSPTAADPLLVKEVAR